MQGFGILAGALVSIIVLACFKSAVLADQNNLDYVWRICIGLGAVPACISIYFRLTMPESPRYKMHVSNQNEIETAEGNKGNKVVHKEPRKATFRQFCKHFSKWKNLKVLLGTTIAWFALDVAFYGVNLNTGIIIEAIGFAGSLQEDPWNALFKDAVGNIIIALMGTVPGYWFTVFLVDRIGRKPIQLMGFGFLTALFLALGFGYDPIKNTSVALFIVLFTLMQFFNNFGPNATTFIIPGEVFPTKYRSTAHGISAASGKLGAIISQVGFFQLKDHGGKNKGIPLILQIFSGFMILGFLVTFLIPETKGKTLEELSGEDELDEEENSAELESLPTQKDAINEKNDLEFHKF